MNIFFGSIPVGNFTLPGPLGQHPTTDAPSQLENVISTAIGVMTVIAFIWFIVQFFVAAFQIISSGGDKAALEGAKQKLTTSAIGLVVVIAAIFLIQIVGTVLGINILTGISDFLYGTTGGT